MASMEDVISSRSDQGEEKYYPKIDLEKLLVKTAGKFDHSKIKRL